MRQPFVVPGRYGVVPFGTPGREGESVRYASVRLRCDFQKFIKKQMPHFTLFRTIGICFFINFENHHPRPNTRISDRFTFSAGLVTKWRQTVGWVSSKSHLYYDLPRLYVPVNHCYRYQISRFLQRMTS